MLCTRKMGKDVRSADAPCNALFHMQRDAVLDTWNIQSIHNTTSKNKLLPAYLLLRCVGIFMTYSKSIQESLDASFIRIPPYSLHRVLNVFFILTYLILHLNILQILAFSYFFENHHSETISLGKYFILSQTKYHSNFR